ncbi:MAG: hypothetical protein WAT79_02995, partial [Saprospiraceae bacterium]
MKIFILFIYLLFGCQIHLYCQELSDIPPFTINNPKWQYYTYDYYFPENPRTPYDTPYSQSNYVKSAENGDDFFILEATATSVIGYIGWDGFRLTKLNKHTGKEIWVHQHNQHTGIKNYERPSPYIGFTSTGDIEILTLRHRDTTIKNDPNWFTFIGTPTVHIIDYHTGKNKSFDYGLDTTRFDHARFTAGGARLHRQKEGKYFSLFYRSVYTDTSAKDYFEFNKVNDSLNIEQTSATLMTMNPEYSEYYGPWTKQIFNKDTMIILTGLEDKIQFQESPSKAFLHWFNIANLDSVHITKTIEVTESFARPQFNVFRYTPELTFKSDHIFLIQHMQPNSRLPVKYFSWLWWADRNGNILGEFDYVSYKDTIYGVLIPIGLKNGKAYFLANYYNSIDNPVEKWDVLCIEPKTMIVTKVGQFLSYDHRNTNFRIQVRKADFLDNGSIVVESNILLRKNGYDYWYAHVCSIDEKTLGISTSTEETKSIPTWSQIYPNPVVDNVSIHIEDVAFVDVVITDLAGSVVVKKSIDSGIENKV